MYSLASHWLRVIGVSLALGVAACHRDVTAPPLPVALHVRPVGSDAPFALKTGAVVPLEALPIASDSTVLGTATPATWSSSDTSVATVTSVGVVQARCVGETTVSAMATISGRSLAGSVVVLVGTTGARCAP